MAIASRILIVEDERIVARDIQKSLQGMGYVVVGMAASGDEAVKKAEKLQPDLVLMDIILEGRMTGVEAADIIRSRINIPIVYLTAYAEKEMMNQAKATLPFGYIIKPFNDRELNSTIEMAIYRHQAERKLEIAREEFSNIVQKSTDGTMILDKKGKILFANPAAGVLFHRSATTLVGEMFGHPVTVGGTMDLDFLRQDGQPGIAEMRVVETRWEGQPACLALLRDITERKRTQEELDRTRRQQLQMRDEFLSHVSHELRSPLTAIYQFVTILLDGLAGELTHDQNEYMNVALQNAYQLRDMIDELLDTTRVESGRLVLETQRISIQPMLQDILRSMRALVSAKNIALISEAPGDLPSVLVDPLRVRQVLRNLIGNAVKFTPESGTVRVSSRVWEENPEMVLVTVEDTGCGIEPEEKERIFERLYQSKSHTEFSRKGLGLGLYICHELITMQGGHIWVDSQPGQGSTFFFTLPVFSLRKILMPILTPENLVERPVILIGIRLSCQEKETAGRAIKKVLRKVREIVERCILPSMDILLPPLALENSMHSIWVVACCDEKRVGVLTLRIRSQLAQDRQLHAVGLEIETFHIIIANTPLKRSQIREDTLNSIVGRIEKAIDPAAQEGGKFNVPSENIAGG